MPATIDDLQKSLQDIIAAVKGGGGSSASASHPAAKSNDAFTELNSRIKAVAATFISVGAVLKGLQGTREGARLDFAMQRIFFEIADMLREPIRLITRELNGLANVMHDINHQTDIVHVRYYNKKALAARAARGGHDTYGDDDHNQPMFKASFGDVAGLQAKFQQLAIESPTQEKGMSILEAIYVKICQLVDGIPNLTPGTEAGANAGATLHAIRDM